LEVVRAVLLAHERQGRLDDPGLVQDEGAPEEGRDLEAEKNFFDMGESALSLAVVHPEPPGGQVQRVRVESHALDPYLPVERLRKSRRKDRLEGQGDQEKTDYRVDRDNDGRPEEEAAWEGAK